MGNKVDLLGLIACSVLLASSLQRVASANICLEQVSSTPGIWMEEHPIGGQMVVASQSGLLQILPIPAVRSNRTSDTGTVFLDLRSRTLFQENTESGFLSFAFHPDFLSNGRFFVSYICNASDCTAPCGCSAADGCAEASCTARTLVAEYSAGSSPTQIALSKSMLPAEVQKIITFGRPSTSRNGGQIWFGTDKFLYFASGDGGVNATAQNGKVPFGKILRVDVNNPTASTWGTYGIPADNPFKEYAAYAEEVYALGFRNPWRCSVDPVSGITVCGDVGEKALEEVNIVESSKNYGWPLSEGSQMLVSPVPDGLVQPVLEYPHAPDTYTSILGGYVYRGNNSACLQGHYVYGDSNGKTYVGTFPPLSSSAVAENGTIFVARGAKIDNSDFPVFSWATDKSGNLYRLSVRGIYRLVNASDCRLDCGFSKLQVPEGVNGPKSASSQLDSLFASVFSGLLVWALVSCMLV